VRRLRIGLGQINTTVGDLRGNTDRIIDGLERAREHRVDLALFPELAISGYPPEDLPEAELHRGEPDLSERTAASHAGHHGYRRLRRRR
jgi:predicted amidohydrolase